MKPLARVYYIEEVDMIDCYVTTSEVCDRLSVSADKVQRLVASGELSGYKFGRCLRISLQSLEAYLRASKTRRTSEDEKVEKALAWLRSLSRQEALRVIREFFGERHDGVVIGDR